MPTALITGASTGLGLELARGLAGRGWSLVVDARRPAPLHDAAAELAGAGAGEVVALPGDVADPAHRQQLIAAARRLGALDLLVNNASALGPSPMPALADLRDDDLIEVLRTNVVAPHALTRDALPLLARSWHPVVLNVSSDAAVEAYPGWGGYGAAKAALDRLSAVLGAEHGAEQESLRVYAVDPGDMRTAMHQAAFPGDDISDRPEPATVVPALLRLLEQRPPSGRYRAAEFAVAVPA